MSWLFGRKKEKTHNTNEAIDKMNDHVSVLEKRRNVLEKKIDQEVNKAKEYLKKGNKNAAAMCMKRKKTYEGQIQKLDVQIMNMQNMGLKLEEAAMDVETIKAQKDGADSLKKIFKTTNIDKIEDDMDKVREAIDNANDISNALAQPLGTDLLDDDEVLDELNQLEQEEMDKQMLNMKAPPTKAPSVKASTKTEEVRAKPATEEDEELAALEAQLNM